jgi:hypothetical protein
MAARRPSDNEYIDALIVAAKQLPQQLEGVKPPEAHDERDDSRPRPRSASSKRILEAVHSQTESCSKFQGDCQRSATCKTRRARDARAGATQTSGTRTRHTRAGDTQAGGLGALRQEHVADKIPTERRLPELRLSERRTGGSDLLFHACFHSLGRTWLPLSNRCETHQATTMSTSADISLCKCRSARMSRNLRNSCAAPRH